MYIKLGYLSRNMSKNYHFMDTFTPHVQSVDMSGFLHLDARLKHAEEKPGRGCGDFILYPSGLRSAAPRLPPKSGNAESAEPTLRLACPEFTEGLRAGAEHAEENQGGVAGTLSFILYPFSFRSPTSSLRNQPSLHSSHTS